MADIAGAGRGRNGGRGNRRDVFVGDKLTRAEQVFAECRFLQGEALRNMAAYVRVSPDQLKRWLERKRARLRNQEPLGENQNQLLLNQQVEIQRLEPQFEQPQVENQNQPILNQQLEPQNIEELLTNDFDDLSQYFEQVVEDICLNDVLERQQNFEQGVEDINLNDVPEQLAVTPHAFKEYSENADYAVHALNDLFTDQSLLYQSPSGDCLINEEEFGKRYPSPNFPNPCLESSYDVEQVRMDATQLARMLTMGNWNELFPAIVSEASIVQTWSNGASVDNPNGAMHLIRNNLIVASHLVPSRNYIFLRKCKRIKSDPIQWLIADTSTVEKLDGHPFQANCLRLESGCLITGTGNGTCQVQWIERTRVPYQFTTEISFKYIVTKGLPYQAKRWTASLGSSTQRLYHRSKCSTQYIRLMDVSQRMILQFMNSRLGNNLLWRDVFVEGDIKFLATMKSGNDDLVVPGGSVSFFLPSPSNIVYRALYQGFEDLEKLIYGQSSPLVLLTSLRTSDHEPDNMISLYRVNGETQVEIREASYNKVESFFVWSRVEENTFSGTTPVMDVPFSELYGITVTSSYEQCSIASTSTSSSNSPTGDGSVVTLALQRPARSPWKQQNPEMMNYMKLLMMNLVEKVKAMVRGS